MSAIRNSGVSVFEGVVKCAINGMYCSDYALCPHYSVSPHFRGVRREGFHCSGGYGGGGGGGGGGGFLGFGT